MPPLISVILPVYNAEAYLREAIESILNQSYTHFEFLIYNDGSTDKSLDIINSFSDSRIVLRNFHENKGLIDVLNQGITESRGKYIARMDADDISYFSRFEEQVNFLEKYQEIGICGTQASFIGAKGFLNKPCDDISLRWWIFKGSPLVHPSVMLRKSVLIDNNLRYDKNAYAVEDYDLWWRMAFFTKMANLDKELLQYRIHPNQVSTAKNQIQTQNYLNNQMRFLRELRIDSNIYAPGYIDELLSRNIECTPQNFKKLWSFFEMLLKSGSALQFFKRENIESMQVEQAVFMLKNLKKYNLRLLILLRDKQFIKALDLAHVNVYSFISKSILHWKTNVK